MRHPPADATGVVSQARQSPRSDFELPQLRSGSLCRPPECFSATRDHLPKSFRACVPRGFHTEILLWRASRKVPLPKYIHSLRPSRILYRNLQGLVFLRFPLPKSVSGLLSGRIPYQNHSVACFLSGFLTKILSRLVFLKDSVPKSIGGDLPHRENVRQICNME